jgi:hypothetical protein
MECVKTRQQQNALKSDDKMGEMQEITNNNES